MVAESDVGPCPHCNSPLEPGSIGFASGLLWSREPLKSWQSLFFVAPAFGEIVLGSLLSTPWLRSRPGYRCTRCGALVVHSDS